MMPKGVLKYFILVTALILLYVHQQTAILRVSYSIEKKDRELARLNEDYKLARYQLARLRSPNFLSRQLKERSLDLTSPKVIEVVTVPVPKVQVPQQELQPNWAAKSSLLSWVGSIKEVQAKTSK